MALTRLKITDQITNSIFLILVLLYSNFLSTYAQYSDECLPNEFRCNDGRCIPESKRCNFVIDCSAEGEDELNCPCTSTEFECDNKQCINSDRHCDGYADCDDGSDEQNCEDRDRECPKETSFQCNSQQCIPKEKRCNMHCDCWDCTDERKCQCPESYFKCGGDETVCIPLSRRCNGVNDCYDRSDEANCPQNETCPPGTHQCPNDPRMCYDSDKICDGIYDCPDGSDETNCSSTSHEQRCRPEQFQCDDGTCIDINRKCDNRRDCRNGEDEIDCECGNDGFRCANGECISASLRCDAVPDCTDESDEDNCPPEEEEECVGFRCSDGTCVLKSNAECDRIFDCNDGSDEENCDVCYPGSWRCHSGECINENERCNGSPDCDDSSDEKNCTCTPYQFRCNDGECLAKEFHCDGVPDCDDESDEIGCACARDEFRCTNSQQCIPNNQVCNDYDDCPDGEDELDCPVSRCESNEFTCANGQCIPDYLRCDRRVDCDDSSDERDCCKPNEFPCKSGECIPLNGQCNGEYQCADGSDEDPQICGPTTTTASSISTACRYGEWRCRSGECIQASAVCDSRVDCRDYSDEDNCPTRTEPPTRAPCRSDEFRCENGPCIGGYLHCDGKVDCPYDSSDELDCPTRYPPSRPSAGQSGGLNLQTYPSSQVRKTVKAKQGEEVVFQCRDEGPIRARIRWVRGNNKPLPSGTKQDNYGRLEIPNAQLDSAGSYICEAIGHSASEPGSRKTVNLEVEPVDVVPWHPPIKVCGPNESMCSNGDCVPTSKICDGEFDCTDGSDERCSKVCEPNEFRCGDGECILKTWLCDTEYDCNDKSDELSCEPSAPGAPCSQREFACSSGNQCVPKSFQCDNHNDCTDGSDEIGCSPIYFTVTPPPMLKLEVGAVLEITCTAIGVPTPLIGWRLNWGYIPSKCTTTSVNGTGNLRCPNFQVEDQGAYSCEAITRHGFNIANPNAIVLVEEPKGVCPRGYFNNEARSPAECISCFCFGVADECTSADLFTYHLPPPFGYDKIVGVRFDGDNVEIDPVYRGPQPNIISTDRYGLQAILRPDTVTDASPYLSLPDSFLGNQLKSYGGYMKYDVRYTGVGRPTSTPTIIITGNGYTLSHRGNPLESNRDNKISVQLFRGEWMKHTPNNPPTPATRGELMMALAAVNNILIKLEYVDSATSETTIKNIQMDSAGVRNTGQGRASFVEKCKCPTGYAGLSCEQCADGYERRMSGPWLGRCVKEVEHCLPGTYGDPNNGIPCAPCPCPYTDPGRQYASTCSLRNGEVVCDCPPGYEGARCEYCESGYTGNPLLGDPCKAGVCDPIGSHSLQAGSDGQCDCKTLTTGSRCERCKPDSFHLAAPNQFGCIACFCMGITRKCRSSNWYRDHISTVFTNSKQGFTLVSSSNKLEPIENIRINPGSREITYDNFPTRSPEVYYWSLPSRYLGDKVTSYGGYLKFTLRYEPVPGGLSSKNTAPDVELISSNDISLWYFKKETPLPSASQTIEVPMLEQYWQRSDGQPADREHMLMALADLESILIKATYTTNTRAASLISVSLDIAQETSRGSFTRALEVEQCTCPEGYRGLSCEDCDVGYTRSDEGLYLRACQPCDCNGHSNDCDPETGECRNCGDHTTGEHCDVCLPGYDGDALSPYGCRYIGSGDQKCNCSKEGSVGDSCYEGQCSCKPNVEGYKCDQCRRGTFALSATNPSGCTECYCSGVTSQCHDSNYYTEQIPVQILDDNHGFTITDLERKSTIDSNFIVNEPENEVGYRFPPGGASHKFWSLPTIFTGNKVTSYGGSLSYTIRFTSSPGGYWSRDQDIVIIGNGITIYWSNNLGEPYPNVPNKISVSIATTAEWQRLDYRMAPRPASREDIMTVLANIDAILVRATPYTNTDASYLSDITLDTALPVRTGQHRATLIELCRCPEGYTGTSCEACETGYYRDIYDTSVPSGACKKCPCNGNEQSCQIGEGNEIVCNCLDGFTGPYCGGEEPGHTTTTESTRPHPIPPQPTIVVTVSEPVMQIVAIGGTVRFHCNAKSIITAENVPVRWSKLGGEIPGERGFDDSRGMLVITELRASDSGTYVCQAEDAYQIVESRATLIVGGNEPIPPKVEISPPYVDVEEGEAVEFRCSSSGNPIPLLRWRRIDKELNPRHEFRGGVFRIPHVTIDDQGEYRCAATNLAGTDEINAIIYVRVRGGTEPTPTKVVQVRPSDITTRSGNQFTLSCTAPSDPYNEFTWEKKPGQLSNDVQQNAGNLTIYNAQPDDSGVYSCMVRGTSGNVGVGYSRVTVITSSTRPDVKVEPEKQTISQGSTTEIRCVVTGSPSPTVKWTKVGEEFGPHIQQIGETLRITNADIRDRGVYVCVAKNEAGFSQASTILEVERREPPQIELYPSSRQVVQMGSSALLQCHITAGIPTPKLTWERSDGRPLSREVEELTGGVLRFTGVTLETAGTYTCHARSEAGETSAIGTIEVQSIPTVTIIPSGEQLFLKEGERLRLECRANGVPQPAVSWRLPENYRAYETEIQGRISQLTAIHEISQVRSEDEGVYTCIAKNDAGITEQSVQVFVEDNEVDKGPTRGDIGGRDRDRYPPQDTSPTLNVSVGTKAEMRCRANQLSGDNTPIHLQWRRQGADLPSNSYERNGTLYINNVQKDHEGVYSCVGYSPTGEILFTANTYLSVHELPHITLSPKRQIVRPGEDATILCQATGTPPIDISWSAIDRDLPRTAYVRGGYLQFYRIQLSDAGLYRCTAQSPTGTADSVAEVVVNEITRGPIISAVERNQEHPLNSSITLECDIRDYQGSEPPQVTWRREGRDLPPNARVEGSRLYLDRLQLSDEGRYICQLPNAVSDYINLIVNRPYTPSPTLRPPILNIEPSLSLVRVGDVLDLRCTGANPGSIITWSKGRGSLPDNVQTSGATLRINGVRSDNAGLYTCETSDPSGNYNVDYILDVEEQQYDDKEPERQEKPKVTYAPRGTSVLMDCTTDLSEPVDYEWSRLRGTIRNPPSSAMLNIAKVNVNDADTYICKTSNYETSTEVRNILVVTGVVPYFAQAPLSYLAFKPLPDAYLKFIIEISFKPEMPDGLILYNGHKRGSPDFISIFMQDGIPEFRFNCGSGTAKIRGDRPLALGQWHTIKVTRSRRQGFMYVDKQGPYQGLAIGKHQGLDLGEPLFIGGVPSYIEMAADSGPNTGFVGCISRLVIEHVEHDLLEEAHESQGVTTCETCATSVCRNNGICQEAPTEHGFKCICPDGLSGLTCERTGASCYPGICGTGRCVETDVGVECQCPMNKTGDRCEETINISEPAFSGDAFIAYPTPKPKRLKMALRFNPATLKDGVLFYCGESEEGNGDFTSLAIKDRRLEFKIDTGTGPVTVRSDTELQPDNWVIVTAMKVGAEVRLMVGGEKPKSVKSTSHKMINLQTPLYVGGYDRQRISLNPSVGVDGGFEGCISGVEVSGENLEVITAASDSANVQDCSNFKRNLYTNNVNDNVYREPPRRTTPPPDPCRDNPCLNNGVCHKLSETNYFCACEYGYTGVHCEIKPDLCAHTAPCRNGGSCTGNDTDYKCDCPMFYTGKNCEQRSDFSTDVSFRGDGYLEINGNLLTGGLDHEQQQQIAIQFTTNSSEGLLLWYGQESDVDGGDRDFLSLAIVGGYLEAAWNLESRPATILYDKVRVDDNKLHLAVFKRDGKYGTLTVDHSDTMVGESDSITDMLNCKGNVYLGGTPNIALMTGQRYTHGFNGCINAIEVQNQERTLDLGDRMIAMSGVNVKACASNDKNFEDDEDDDSVGEDLVN